MHVQYIKCMKQVANVYVLLEFRYHTSFLFSVAEAQTLRYRHHKVISSL